ncbi:MAG TPA: energy transducer TonB [Terracidiphilus sp.]|nr:energy transducer TonB [Terracidiphilus sp.]
MFEDSTFESNGKIRTRSRGWMIATFAFNGSILFALILIPFIYPEALPHQAFPFLLTPPPPPAAPLPQQPPQQNTPRFHGAPEIDGRTLIAPRRVPTFAPQDFGPEAPAPIALGDPNGVNGAPPDVFNTHRNVPTVHPMVKSAVRLSSTVVEGLLIHKVVPTYPPIALSAHIQGTVVLAATISKGGTIENLHVVSGQPMLQQAALDAVQHWAYRPYLLNGEPVAVETTVNVVFTLGR